MFRLHSLVKVPKKQSTRRVNGDVNQQMSETVRVILEQHPWLVCVSLDYLNDNFNLYGLSKEVPGYAQAIKLLRGIPLSPGESETIHETRGHALQLYGLVHARYISTYRGAQEVGNKYESGVYGTCPRILCNHHKLLPIGLSPDYGKQKLRGFCPNCSEVYDIETEMDGAFFGPSFPQFYLKTFSRTGFEPEKVDGTTTFLGIPVSPEFLYLVKKEASQQID